MRFTVILFGLVAFLAAVVGMLGVLGPSGSLSLFYVLFAGLFVFILREVFRSMRSTDSSPIQQPSKLWLVITVLINIAGGIAAFFVYWNTRDHLSSSQVLVAFTASSLLPLKLGGGNIEPK